jgi:hypothetical protein
MHLFSSPLNRYSALLSFNVWTANHPGPDRRYSAKSLKDQNQGMKVKVYCKFYRETARV